MGRFSVSYVWVVALPRASVTLVKLPLPSYSNWVVVVWTGGLPWADATEVSCRLHTKETINASIMDLKATNPIEIIAQLALQLIRYALSRLSSQIHCLLFRSALIVDLCVVILNQATTALRLGAALNNSICEQ